MMLGIGAGAIFGASTWVSLCVNITERFSFQDKGILVHLGELDELDQITHAAIRIHLQYHTSREDTLVLMVSMPDCCESDLGSIPGQVCKFLMIFVLLN